MSAGVLDLATPGGTAWWQWLAVFAITATVLFSLARLAMADNYSYSGPDGVAIVATAGAGVVGLYALAACIRFYDLKWPENHLGMAFLIPLMAAGVTVSLWFFGDVSGPQITLIVVSAVLTLAAIVWWSKEAGEVVSRAFASAGGLGAFVAAAILVAAFMAKK